MTGLRSNLYSFLRTVRVSDAQAQKGGVRHAATLQDPTLPSGAWRQYLGSFLKLLREK